MQVMSANGELIRFQKWKILFSSSDFVKLDFVMLKEHGVTVCEEYYDKGGNAFCAITAAQLWILFLAWVTGVCRLSFSITLVQTLI